MPPLSGQDGVETFTATLEKESVVTAKVLALSEESKEPESEIVRFFAGAYLLHAVDIGYCDYRLMTNYIFLMGSTYLSPYNNQILWLFCPGPEVVTISNIYSIVIFLDTNNMHQLEHHYVFHQARMSSSPAAPATSAESSSTSCSRTVPTLAASTSWCARRRHVVF